MSDGWIMDISYLLCKLYCKWYCNCEIVFFCDAIAMLNFVFVPFEAFLMTIKPITPMTCVIILDTAYPTVSC